MTRRMSLWLCAIGMLVLSTAPAYAFLGFGDVVYNPTEYAQFGKTIEQGKQLYDASVKQLDNLASIEQSINNANQAYQNLRNYNLSDVWANLQPTSLQGTTTPIATLRSDLTNTTSGVEEDASYVRYQLDQLSQIEKLAAVQQAAASDNHTVTAPGTKPTPAQSAQVTAASTSALAALAASEERRRTTQDFARAQAYQTDVNAFKDNSVYNAIGQGARSSAGQ